MKKNFKIISIAFTAILFCSIIFVSKSAKASIPPGRGKQLVPCAITVGTTVTQVGNTCGTGGDGCTPNPCGE